MAPSDARVPRIDVGLLPQESIAACGTLAAEAEALGFGGVWIADSQSVFRDAYLALALAGAATSRMSLATGVTNPVTRHPAVIAGQAGTLAELSGGRMILGIGVGESAVRNVGLKPASIAQLGEAIEQIRLLLSGERAVVDGRKIALSWRPPHVPIYVAASGPKALRLAGRLGDGVLFQVGARPDLVQYAIDEIAAGAREAGRDLADIELCMRLGAAIGDDGARARAEMLAYASVAANTLARTLPVERVPDDLAPDLQALRAAYDYGAHGYQTAEHRTLMTDPLLDAVAIAGTPEETVPRFVELSRLGIDRFVIPVNVPNKSEALQILARELIGTLGRG